MDISAIPTLETLLTGLASGTLTYPASRYLFRYLKHNDYLSGMTPADKRWIVLGIAILLSAVGLFGSHYYLDWPLNFDTAWASIATAFLVSQKLHSEFELRNRVDEAT